MLSEDNFIQFAHYNQLRPFIQTTHRMNADSGTCDFVCGICILSNSGLCFDVWEDMTYW